MAWVEVGLGEKPAEWTQVGQIEKQVKEDLLFEIPAKFFTKRGKWSVR